MGFLHTALCQPLLSSPLLLISQGKVARKKRVSAMASFTNGDCPINDGASVQRRVFCFVGVSFLPFFQLSEVAAKGRPQVDMASLAGGFANVFLSQRNRSKASKFGGTKLSEESTFEGRQNPNSPKLIDSEIAAFGPEETKEESGVQAPIKTEEEDEAQSAGPAQAIVEAQLPRLSELEITSGKINQSMPQATQSNGGTLFVSFLNDFGIIGSGVLGALYAMKSELNKQMRENSSIKEVFNMRLLNENEEHKRQTTRLSEEITSLSSQSASANNIIAALGRELSAEKRLAEDFKAQIDQLGNCVTTAIEEKKMLEALTKEKVEEISALQDKLNLLGTEVKDKEESIQNLNLMLKNRESEYKSLSFTVEQARADLAAANSNAEQFQEDVHKAREELNLKNSFVNDLNDKINLLIDERDEVNRKFCHLKKEYNDFISSVEKKASVVSELITKKDELLQQVEEQLKLALDEVSNKQTMISELTIERDNVKGLLQQEQNDMQKLKNELQTTQEMLTNSSVEASGVSEELRKARTAYEEISSKILDIQDEYNQARKLLNSNLEESMGAAKLLSEKLESAMVVLQRTEEELVSASDELKAAMEERESFKRELVDSYRKLEARTKELQEERKQVENLNRELEVLHERIMKDSEARKTLESDLEEATRSLDEMNDNALLLSKEMENVSSRSSCLETEKEVLFKSLMEQKNSAKKAQENMEDAQNLIIKLGNERQNLEKRSKRLEEELATAKGEILRLRRQISLAQESVNAHHTKANEVPSGTPSSVKRTAGRRRKGGTSSNAS
ncbi:MAR-binding filament-like protein 1-1 [Apostasia shenzhenica]|uniref:MAR-binding filament-like protein 1-1 n=1 Tax=Apostasia shenzhenica TaxID=1088818 RepID=A0A2I0B6L7_9ASPA|nr:MAR-binding filament-like protein 1-1 [Apostasia shenzhenica]